MNFVAANGLPSFSAARLALREDRCPEPQVMGWTGCTRRRVSCGVTAKPE